MKIEDIATIVLSRIAATVIIGSVFLPPDYSNPHAAEDASLLLVGGLIWGLSDILLHAKDLP